MFGMLDYRAHKLYWLLSRPLWLLSWAIFFGTVLASFAAAAALVTNPFGRFFAALFCYQILSLLTFLLMKGIQWCFDKTFEFLVDVEPAGARTQEEARAVLEGGQTAILLLKPLSTLTDADFEYLLKKSGWIARIFFSDAIRARQQLLSRIAKERVAEGSRELQLHEAKDIVAKAGLAPPWYETAACKGPVRAFTLNQVLMVSILAAMTIMIR